jgi:hypothetical protein
MAVFAGPRRGFGLGFFFIGLPLTAGSKAGTDDSDQIPAFDMRDDDQPSALGLANQDKTFLTDRVVRIGDRQRERVGEGGRSFWKPDPVLPADCRPPSVDPS